MEEIVDTHDALSSMDEKSKGMMAMKEAQNRGGKRTLQYPWAMGLEAREVRYSLRTVLTVTVSLARINGKLRKMP